MSTQNSQLEYLLQNFRQQRPLRAGSLIMTVFGDAIVPRGGVIWIGSLIKLLQPMGISQRLVRTSMFRLGQEGWLTSNKVGRCSYYRLTDAGRRQFQIAFRRVYAAGEPRWNGAWTLVILNQLRPDLRERVQKELKQMGMGAFAPTVLAHPTLEITDLNNTLQELDALESTIILKTRKQTRLSSQPLRQQVHEAWDLDHLSVIYSRFIDQFLKLWDQMKENPHLQPADCFLARTMLVHEYRKLLLRDPLLPEELRPADWVGNVARQLCRNLYRLIYKQSEQWLDEHAETVAGPLPVPTESFYQRFGGLD